MKDEKNLPEFVRNGIDLAQPRLGTLIHSCSDEFFAACERMLQADEPQFIEGKFDQHGKWMDGWETRRRRTGGNDWAIIQLGKPGRIFGVDLDTRHFTGNYPPAASLQACNTLQLDDDTQWTTLIGVTELGGDRHHYIEVDSDAVWTHLRLNIFPDGGIARLRVYGRIDGDWDNQEPSQRYELSAMENGGRAIAWNDAHFGQVSNLFAPGKGINMGDGWETRRRREPGNDWCIIELGHRGLIEEILVDTAYFKGNYPDRCSIQAADVTAATTQSLITQSMFWQELLPPQKLEMDREVRFASEINKLGAVTHIRFNIFPDGGVSRLRLFGKLA